MKVKKLFPDAKLPVYATEGAACFDLRVHPEGWAQHHIDNGVRIDPGQAYNFRTGLAFEVPEGQVMLVFSRSGHGFKNGTRLANCVGVIDSDYRGELRVNLHCDGQMGLTVHPGDRIAQAMLLPVKRVKFEEVEELSETQRGAGGFGSTGN